MAESPHDDLADALAKMANGDVAPSEHEPAAPPPVRTQPRAVKPASTRPTAATPTTAKPAAAPVVKTPEPSPSAPVASVRPAAPVRAARPAAPSSPAPVAATAPVPQMAIPPSARRARPAAPTTRSFTVSTPQNTPEMEGGQSTGLSNAAPPGDAVVIDDDDSVIVPAPDPSVFDNHSKSTAEMRKKVARQKSLDFRRTLIPILLTSGVLLIIFGSLKFVSGSDSVLTDLNIGIPIGLFFMAIVLLALAAVNMISVKKQQESDRPA